jgi:hypothetical protein
MLMGAALLGSPLDPATTAAAAAGGLAPDLPLILRVVWAQQIERHKVHEIFGRLYFSRAWQAFLAPWHSVFLWGGILILAALAQSSVLAAFSLSGLIHSGVDFFLHVDDAHLHFWPVSDWRFRSPVSYWDSSHYGRVVRPIELALALACAVWLVLQYRSLWAGIAFGAIAALYALQLALFWRAFRATTCPSPQQD